MDLVDDVHASLVVNCNQLSHLNVSIHDSPGISMHLARLQWFTRRPHCEAGRLVMLRLVTRRGRVDVFTSGCALISRGLTGRGDVLRSSGLEDILGTADVVGRIAVDREQHPAFLHTALVALGFVLGNAETN